MPEEPETVGVVLPGTDGPRYTVRRGWLANKLLADGERVKTKLRRQGWRRVPTVPLANGGTGQLRGWLNLRLEVVGGGTYPLERPLCGWERILVGLPLVMAIPAVTGGALGFLFGLGGVAINARIARAVHGTGSRVLATVGVSVLLVVTYLAANVALVVALRDETRSPSAEDGWGLSTGTCLTAAGGRVTNLGDYQVTSCDTAHDAEVAAIIATGLTSYPGATSIRQFADDHCREELSHDEVSPRVPVSTYSTFVPTQEAWKHLQASVLCLALPSPGLRLTAPLLRHASSR